MGSCFQSSWSGSISSSSETRNSTLPIRLRTLAASRRSSASAASASASRCERTIALAVPLCHEAHRTGALNTIGVVPFRPRAEIRIELEPDEAPPGDSVEVAIRVVPGDDLELVEGRIDLVYENEYTYRTRRYSYLTKLSSVRDETVTDVVVEESARFLEAGALVADTPYEDAVTLTVPESAAPSAEGQST